MRIFLAMFLSGACWGEPMELHQNRWWQITHTTFTVWWAVQSF